MEESTATRKERREQARAERQEKAAQAAAAAERKRRLALLGGVLGVAIVAVVIAIVVSSGGSSDKGSKGNAGVQATSALLAGIPQSGITLGKADAPVTFHEYADLQCPFCREFAEGAFPTVVREYIRTGKVKMVFHTLSFIGPDSVTAARAAQAAGKQGKLFNFMDRFYANQQTENTGYVTHDFLTRIANEVPGLNTTKLFADADDPSTQQALVDADQHAKKFGINSTPSFVIGKTGQKPKLVNVSSLTDPQPFRDAIDPLLK